MGNSSHKERCSVCWEYKGLSLDCNHPLCKDCISMMRNDICPVCRQKLSGTPINSKILQIIRDKRKDDLENRPWITDYPEVPIELALEDQNLRQLIYQVQI